MQPTYEEFCAWRDSVMHPSLNDAMQRFPGTPAVKLTLYLVAWWNRQEPRS